MDKNSVTIFFALLLLITAILSPLAQQAQAVSTCTLTVTVVNEYNRNPIIGANVSISGPIDLLLVTDSNGKVSFLNIPTGIYQILTSAKEYPNKQSHTVTLTGDQNYIVLFGYTKAFFTYNPQNVTTNNSVSFNGSLSSSSGNITSYQWHFGDNTTATGIFPTHNYTRTGSYTVVLTVTSTHGTATYSQIIPVRQVPVDPWPFPWILILIPFLLPIPIILIYRRKRYYVVIQARVPLNPKHLHCPGNGTECDDCKLTPC
jgi:hypothetical protein